MLFDAEAAQVHGHQECSRQLRWQLDTSELAAEFGVNRETILSVIRGC